MQIRKNYKIRAAMGDGRPVDDIITAKSGTEAHDLAKIKHPGSRAIYVLGLAENQPEPSIEETIELLPAHPIFDPEEDEQQRNIRWCIQLRNQGKSHRAIAGVLGVGSSTVGRWLKTYG